jgi:hypothetical protein
MMSDRREVTGLRLENKEAAQVPVRLPFEQGDVTRWYLYAIFEPIRLHPSGIWPS